MSSKRLPQTTNCTQMHSTPEAVSAHNHYYCMDAAVEENIIHVSNTHTSTF
jgi:hypothetical protein